MKKFVPYEKLSKKKQREPEAPKAPTEAELLARTCELLEENNRLQKETKETH